MNDDFKDFNWGFLIDRVIYQRSYKELKRQGISFIGANEESVRFNCIKKLLRYIPGREAENGQPMIALYCDVSDNAFGNVDELVDDGHFKGNRVHLLSVIEDRRVGEIIEHCISSLQKTDPVSGGFNTVIINGCNNLKTTAKNDALPRPKSAIEQLGEFAFKYNVAVILIDKPNIKEGVVTIGDLYDNKPMALGKENRYYDIPAISYEIMVSPNLESNADKPAHTVVLKDNHGKLSPVTIELKEAVDALYYKLRDSYIILKTKQGEPLDSFQLVTEPEDKLDECKRLYKLIKRIG